MAPFVHPLKLLFFFSWPLESQHDISSISISIFILQIPCSQPTCFDFSVYLPTYLSTYLSIYLSIYIYIYYDIMYIRYLHKYYWHCLIILKRGKLWGGDKHPRMKRWSRSGEVLLKKVFLLAHKENIKKTKEILRKPGKLRFPV